MPGLPRATVEHYRAEALNLMDVVALDAIADDEERRKELRRLAEALVAAVGCTLETARKHIARAARIKRHPNYTGAGGYTAWGGQRPGAGRPKNEAEGEDE